MPLLLLSLLRNNWKLILILLCASIWSAVCWQAGARHIRNEWNIAILEATNKAREIESNNVLLNQKIGVKYETGIKAIDDAYNSALASLQPTASNGVRLTPTTASKPTCTTNADELHKRNARLKLARQAEINTQKLISLQEWVQEFE